MTIRKAKRPSELIQLPARSGAARQTAEPWPTLKSPSGKRALRRAGSEPGKIAAKPAEARRQKSNQGFVWPFP
jgi:hypothetical protein